VSGYVILAPGRLAHLDGLRDVPVDPAFPGAVSSRPEVAPRDGAPTVLATRDEELQVVLGGPPFLPFLGRRVL
jgi:hypothetical protein